MLCVTPPAKVKPTVVFGIYVIKYDKKALITVFFSGFCSKSVRCPLHRHHRQDRRATRSIRHLRKHTFLEFPITTGVRDTQNFFFFILLTHSAECKVSERCLRRPRGNSQLRYLWRYHFLHHTRAVRVILYHAKHPIAQVLCHQLLHVIRGCAHHLRSIETYHIRLPMHIVFVDKDRRIAGHMNNVRVVFHPHHKHCFTERGIEVAHLSKALRYGIFSAINLGTFATISVVFTEVVSKPSRVAVIVFVNQFYGFVTLPLGVIVSPSYHITNKMHMGILSQHSIFKLFKTLIITIALRIWVWLIILVPYFQILDIERRRMSIGCSHCSIFGCNISIGIFQCVHTLVNPSL